MPTADDTPETLRDKVRAAVEGKTQIIFLPNLFKEIIQ
jgi:hypothetical protein